MAPGTDVAVDVDMAVFVAVASGRFAVMRAHLPYS
jgi:hypothetical protein